MPVVSCQRDNITGNEAKSEGLFVGPSNVVNVMISYVSSSTFFFVGGVSSSLSVGLASPPFCFVLLFFVVVVVVVVVSCWDPFLFEWG